MSAIAGLIHIDGSRLDRDTLHRMQSLLAPYGRDAQHSWHQGSGGLTRTLLRITPEDSLDQQPMWHSRQQLALAFDGRLDNREELIAKLEITQSSANRMADSELALHACIRWDSDAPAHLLGDYALACWQPRRQRLWLARDALGMRPLFWYRTDNLFAFASMPKALFAVPGLTKALCEESLHDYLCMMPMSGPQSMYKEVFRVEPGEIVELYKGRISKHYYFRFDPDREIRLASNDDYAEGLKEQLERATQRRLRSRGPIASHLSSGLDSSAVTAVAARLLQGKGESLLAYTAAPREGFNGPVPSHRHVDETLGAKSLVKQFDNIEHIILRRDKDSTPLDDLQAIIEQLDRAPLNACNMQWEQAIREDAAQRNVKVLLNGNLGNISISHDGMPYLPWLLLHGRWLLLAKHYRQLKHRNPSLHWRRMVRPWCMPLVPNTLWRAREHAKGRIASLFDYSAINPSWSRHMNSEKRARRMGFDLSHQPSWQGRKQRITSLYRIDIGEYNASTNVHGMEDRDPTADRELMAFCLAVPESQYMGGGQTKWLIRRAMRGTLPGEILDTVTRGIQAPDWHENTEKLIPQMRQALEKLRNHENAGTYLDIDAMEQAIEDWPEEGWDDPKVETRFRLQLLRGMSVGGFIRYAEEGNE
ncbi:asparagine synthetase B family protein [Halomonas salinarum]|uniref:asparagine synthetase B family protein n=1 Tax=Halomonas salinarum TaxID=1158993 RepID=UPI00143A2C21|nr:asparagine synthetase B [Halomonas salinarum]